jgi:putative ABC transport system permease protein
VLAALGVGVGLAAAALLARTMETLVYGVRPLDPLTFAIVSVVLLVVAVVACAVPAHRATRVDPAATLRA